MFFIKTSIVVPVGTEGTPAVTKRLYYQDFYGDILFGYFVGKTLLLLSFLSERGTAYLQSLGLINQCS